MEFKTKFDINNLLQYKFEKSGEDRISALEVIEVLAQSCSAGVEVFYLCRSICAEKKFKHPYKNEGDFEWIIGHGIHNQDFSLGYKKYREDELVELKQEHINVILGT